MNLNFSPPREVRSGGTVQIIRDARATPEFWAKWRYNKQAISDLGVCLIPVRKPDGKPDHWIVRQVTRPAPVGEVPVKVPPVPLTDRSGLLDYQYGPVSELLGSMISNRVALDASDTGTGKTYMALKTCKVLGFQPAIVCTRPGIDVWLGVCRHFKLNPIFIYNWESTIGRIFKDRGRIRKITQPPCKYIGMGINEYTGKPVYKWRMPPAAKIVLIFDEVHKATGDGSHNQRIVHQAKMQGYRIMALSATMTDKLAKFKIIGSLIGLFEYDRFDEWMKKQGGYVNNFNQWETLSENQDMLRLSKTVFPNFGIRVRKSEVPGFPDVQNIARLYTIGKADLQNQAYEKLLGQIERLKKLGKTADILVKKLRYRQLAEMYKVPLLADLVAEYRESGMSVVVMVNFTDTLTRLAGSLRTKCVVWGEQEPEERAKAIADFQSDKSRVLIANIKAGGQSISLHDLNGEHPRICLICPTYDAKDLVQAMGRIHRAGAKSKAINLLVYAAGTVETEVYKSVSAKIKNINTFNDGDLAETEVFLEE